MFDQDNYDFTMIANKLLNQMVLKVNNKCTFRICEIEMYLKNQFHPDNYVHSNIDQQSWEKFYFHKYSNGTIKSGTWKGLDITLGNTETNTYFGILIRSIYDESNGEFIEGPCKCVNKILELFECDDIKSLINLHFNPNEQVSIYNDKLKISFDDNLIFQPIYVGSRIGLSGKYPDYASKLYRFCIYNNKIKKERKNLIIIDLI